MLERIPGDRRFIERAFPELVADGGLYALGSDARWLDAGTPATFLAANLAYAPLGPDGPRVSRSVVAEDVAIASDAEVTGPW